VTAREILARIEFVIEALGDGDTMLACDVLLDLRDDLLGAAAENEEPVAV
jgi:hypothetical protein